jgi:hypothetical protein
MCIKKFMFYKAPLKLQARSAREIRFRLNSGPFVTGGEKYLSSSSGRGSARIKSAKIVRKREYLLNAKDHSQKDRDQGIGNECQGIKG